MFIDDYGFHVYVGKDKRLRAYDTETKKITSYPKLLMQKKLGRALEPYEDVHHIDENPLNNDLDNLEIKIHGDHQREHSKKYFDIQMKCDVCGKYFVWTAKRQSNYYRDLRRGKKRIITCSKKCSSKYGRYEQLGRDI